MQADTDAASGSLLQPLAFTLSAEDLQELLAAIAEIEAGHFMTPDQLSETLREFD